MPPSESSSEPPTKRLKVEKEEDPEGSLPSSLTLVSFNVSGFQPSQAAPNSWTEKDSMKEVERIILKRKPDVIALQEVPSYHLSMLGQRYFSDFRLIGSKSSHCKQVVLLVRKYHKANLYTPIRDELSTPSVIAELDFSNTPADEAGESSEANTISRKLLVASVHLEPFKDGEQQRRRKLKKLVKAARHLPMIIIGDMNMRVAEDMVAEEGLGMLDMWKIAGSNFANKYTWNTRNEIDKGGYFNQYHGNTTREYVTRYDRMYLANVEADLPQKRDDENDSKHDNVGETLKVLGGSFDLIGNRPIGDSKRHFLSDHFGIASRFTMDWKRKESKQS